jgi:hypothetical protein
MNIFIKLNDIFSVHGVGIITARDKLTIHFAKEQAFQLVSVFSTIKEEIARKVFKLREDTRDWEVKQAQQDLIESNVDIKKIVPWGKIRLSTCFSYYNNCFQPFSRLKINKNSPNVTIVRF